MSIAVEIVTLSQKSPALRFILCRKLRRLDGHLCPRGTVTCNEKQHTFILGHINKFDIFSNKVPVVVFEVNASSILARHRRRCLFPG